MPDYRKVKCLSHLAEQIKRVLDGVETLEARFLPGRVDMVKIWVKGNVLRLELPGVYSFEYTLPDAFMTQLTMLLSEVEKAIEQELSEG